MMTQKKSSSLYNNFTVLHHLARQILHCQTGNRKIPHVKIDLEEKQKCESYRKSNSRHVIEETAVKLENGTNVTDTTGCQETISSTAPVLAVSGEICQLCLQSSNSGNSFLESYRLESLYIGDYEREVIQTIFHASIESGSRLIFCERCFQCMTDLRACYLEYKSAQKIYHETMLRVRYFKKCADEMALSSNFNIPSDPDFSLDNDNNDDHFEESWESNLLIDVKMDLQSNKEEDNRETLSLEANKIQTKNNKRPCRQKYNYKGKYIQRQGGLTEEQYQEHRRLQMRQYYLDKKRKLGKLEIGEKPAIIVKRVQKKTIGRDEYKTSMNSKHVDNSSQFEDRIDELKPATGKKTTKNINKNFKTRNQQVKSRRKYDYKGRVIRRRGGLTEEQYQEHRRAQSAGYYFERRKKIGKLTFGPKMLNPIDSARLERAEKVCLDSNNLPAKSSWGARVPVVQLDEDRRFTYRNVEFTKNEDGTYQCGKCGRTMKVLNVMRKHIAKIHFDKDHGYKCSYCDKTFYYHYQLKYHEGSHTTKGAGIQCEECGKSFKYYAGFYFHRKSVHQGIKPHECQLCQKQFGTKKDLRKHTESLSHRSKENATGGNTEGNNSKTEEELGLSLNWNHIL